MRKFTLLFFAVVAFIGLNAQSLIFSEYIEGSSNNKAIELYNATGAELNLDGYSILRANNGGDYSDTIKLTGVLADKAVYVIANASADEAILSKADTTSTITFFNGDDALALYNNDVLVDVFGLQGEDPGSAWDVAGVAGATANHTLVRKDSVTTGETTWSVSAGTDSISSGWVVLENNDFSKLGWHITPPSNEAEILSFVLANELAPAIISPDLAQVTATVNFGVDLTALAPEITLSAGAVQVSPTTATVDFTKAVKYTIKAADGTEKVWNVAVVNPSITTIYDLQYVEGDSDVSPYTDYVVQTEGIVTASAYNGFFLQNEAATWNGIWVYTDADTAVVGTKVSVLGTVAEWFGLTEIIAISVDAISEGNDLPAEQVVALADFNEPYEGVLVKIENVTCASVPDDHGEWTVTDGTNTITVDDLMFEYIPEVGDEFASITGVVTYSFGAYKLLPRNEADVDAVIATVQMTFNVDMEKAELADGDEVYVTGNFNGWDQPGTGESVLLTDDDNDGIYTGTAQVPAEDSVAYKYFVGASWDVGDPEGDRYVITAGEDVAVNDVWGGVSVDRNVLELVKMYPNPVISTLHIENLDEVSKLRITNILGAEVMVKEINQSKVAIDVAEMESGVYVLTLVAKNGEVGSKRFIID